MSRIEKISGPKADPEEIWNLLFDDKVITPILQWSNKRLAKMRSKYKNINKSDTRDIDLMEFKGFRGYYC